MIWFTVLRSYKDAHAKKIVQRILNGTDKDILLDTVVHLETEQQKALFEQFEKADAEILDRREQHTASYSIGKFCDRSLFLLPILANMYNHTPLVFWQ